MGFVGQLLDLKGPLKTNEQVVRKAIERLIRQNKDLANAVKPLQKGAGGRDRALVEVIRRNPAVHAALIEALMNRLK